MAAGKKRRAWAGRRPTPTCDVGILHAFGPGYLHAPNRVLEFRGQPDRRLRVPMRGLHLVCIYGPVRVTAGAVRIITDAGAGIAYLPMNGARTNGILQPSSDAWKGRRYRQFQASSNRPWRLDQARQLIVDKIESVITVVRYLQRHGRSKDRRLVRRFRCCQQQVRAAESHEVLRGIEGSAAKVWFDVMARTIPRRWRFDGRNKRPPVDPVNCLLSLGYTVLFHRVEAACQAWGLDPAVGVFHEYRAGRSSLACDLMEPFRASIVDRLVIATLNRGQFSNEDFTQGDRDHAVTMTEDAFRRYLGLLEGAFHCSTANAATAQSQVMRRVSTFVNDLPKWDGRWPEAVRDADNPPQRRNPRGES